MNNAEKVARIHEIDVEMARLREEKERLMSDVRNSHGIVVVGDHGRGNADLLLEVLDRIAYEGNPGITPFLMRVLPITVHHSVGSLISWALKEKFMPVDVSSGINLRVRKELANQKEIRRGHHFSDHFFGLRKKARGYF